MTPEGQVLLVTGRGSEDLETLRIQDLLGRAGYRLVTAPGGPDALEAARRSPPDVILLDTADNGAMGAEACRALRASPETRELPLLVVVPRDSYAELAASLDSGADDFIGAPVDPAELLARVRAAMRGRAIAEELRRAADFTVDLFARVGTTVTSPFRPDEELARVLSHTLEAVPARRGRLLLYDPHRRQMEVSVVAGERTADALEVGATVPEGPPPDGVLRLPLVAGEVPLGAIEVDLRGQPPLPRERLKLLKALASQASIFLENLRLNRDVRRMFLDIIVSLAGAVDAKDAYTHGHTVRVARVSLLLARAAGLEEEQRESLLLAALLHDVGKIGVPDAILKKPGPLDPDERAVMRQHPVIGAQMLRHIRALRDALPGIRHHHEHWDGSGYPDGLAGPGIPVSARIILVADAFDAMTSDRVYRKGMAIDVALEKMRAFSGRQFDPGRLEDLGALCADGAIRQEDCSATPDLLALLRAGA